MRLLPATLLLVSCATTPREHPASKSVEVEPEPSLTFREGGHAMPDSVVWNRARELDPMDLSTLAEQVGSGKLMEFAEAGGPTGALALRALPLASDARAQRARLCELLTEVRVQERSIVVETVHQLLTEATELHEELSAEGDGACKRRLNAVARDEQAPPRERDLAASAVARLH